MVIEKKMQKYAERPLPPHPFLFNPFFNFHLLDLDFGVVPDKPRPVFTHGL